MSWPDKVPPSTHGADKRSLGAGVFRLCDGCGATHTAAELAASFEVCGACGHHHRLDVDGWRRLVLDDGALTEWDAELAPADPLRFEDGRLYGERIAQAQKKANATEAVEIGRGAIESIPIAYGCFHFGFLGGSMGSVVGEKVTRLFERATAERLPVVLLQASGGARMQEGILSLMQMAKCVAALERLRAAGLPYFSVLLHPTTGGVAASFSFLGDVNIAEPGALIGFAGPRVIESTLRQTLPRGFQRAEFLVEHGMIDAIAPRRELRALLTKLLRHLVPVVRGSRGSS